MSDQQDLEGMYPAQTVEGMTAAELADVPESKWGKALVSMVQVLEARNRARGLAEDEAFALACDSVLALAEYFGGRVWYLPRGDRLKIALRDASIHRQWQRQGVVIQELAAAHKLTEIHLYRIIAQQRELHLRKTQHGLPLNFDQEGL